MIWNTIESIMRAFMPIESRADRMAGFLENENHYVAPEVVEKHGTEVPDSKVIAAQTPGAEPQFAWPVDDRPPRVTCPYGWRTLYPNGVASKNFHIGTDYASGEGEAVFAIEDCIVKAILLPDPRYPARFKYVSGTWKEVAPADRAWTPYVKVVGIRTGTWYSYKHVRAKDGLKVGHKVKCGAVLGTTGQLGYSMGPHLHLEVWPAVDPAVQTKAYGLTNWPEPTDPHKFLSKRLSDAPNPG